MEMDLCWISVAGKIFGLFRKVSRPFPARSRKDWVKDASTASAVPGSDGPVRQICGHMADAAKVHRLEKSFRALSESGHPAYFVETTIPNQPSTT